MSRITEGPDTRPCHKGPQPAPSSRGTAWNRHGAAPGSWPCSPWRAPSPGRLWPRSQPTAPALPCRALGLQPGLPGAGGIGRPDGPGPCGQWLRVHGRPGTRGVPRGCAWAPGLVPASVSDTRGTERSPSAFAGHGELSGAGAPRKHREPARGRAGESQAGKPGEAAQSWPGDLGTWETEPGSELTLRQIPEK